MTFPALDPSVLIFLPKAGHSLSIAKLAYFNLKMTTAVDRYARVGSWQSVDQDEAAARVHRCLHSFPC